MKTFKQYINEIFDNPYEYTWFEKYRIDSSFYFFTEENKLYSIRITERLNNNVEVGFSAHPDYLKDMKFAGLDPLFKDNIIDYIRTYGTDSKLNIDTKDVPRIFATVIAAAEEYYNKYKPDMIFFRAKNSEENRVTLYTRIAKRFAYKFNLNLEIDKGDYSTAFKLIKK